MLKTRIEEEERREPQAATSRKIVYVLGRFPVLSETFVQQELLELERQGTQIQIFSLFKVDNTQRARATWRGRAAVTCIADHPLPTRIIIALRYLLRAPHLRVLRAGLAMLGHYRLNVLVGCRVLLSAAFLATQFEHEEIIHIHAHFAAEAASVAQFTHLLTGLPYSFTAHANDIYLSSQAALAYKMQMARFVVTVTEYNRAYLTGLVDHETARRIHCIYNGLNTQQFPLLMKNASLQGTKQPIILSVCRLVEKKGLFYLLQACRILANQQRSFLCYIVGEGPLRHELEQQVRDLALEEQVQLLGARTHEQVLAMYHDATVMALPCVISKNGDRDGLPTVLIEALHAGIPAVSTTVSGIAELITTEENGLLVPPNDSAALAAALARLLDDPSLRSHLAAAGQKTVRERFDLARNAENLMRLMCENTIIRDAEQ